MARRYPTNTDSLHILVTDYHGSLRSEVGFGSGGGTDLIEYYPYGELYMQSGSSKSRFEFIGKERDNVRDLDFGPRYNNSTVGHFLSPDPILSAPSAYAYTDGNPVMQYDPSGLCVQPEILWKRTVTMGGPSDDGSDPDPFDIDPYARLSDYTGGNSTPTTVQGTPPGLNIGLAPAPPDMTSVPGYNMNTLPQINGGDTWCRGFNSSGNVSYGGGTGGRGGGGGGSALVGLFGLNAMYGHAANAAGGLGTGMKRAGGTFRMTNGAYNGSRLSIKWYRGFRGGSVARITTYSCARWGSILGRGSFALGVGLAAVDIGVGIYEDGYYGENAQLATGRAAGGFAGGLAGAWAGAQAGAWIGSLFAGVGAIPGFVIGGIIGGIGGGIGGGWLGSGLGERVVMDFRY